MSDINWSLLNTLFDGGAFDMDELDELINSLQSADGIDVEWIDLA